VNFVQGNPRLQKLLRHSSRMKLADRYRKFQSLIERSELQSILSSEIYDLTNSENNFDILWSSLEKKDALRQMQECDLHTYLPGDLLLKADLATMANSLELRSPFLDYRVVEFGLSLPNKYKIKNGETKYILKDILSEYIPRELFDRPKMGFGIPRAKWLREELRELVLEVLFSKDFRQRNWFNQKAIEAIVREHNFGRDLDRVIWPILMLEIWAKNWID
jgi:asparagine synthase (glutamine-hydrolysing)